nr:MAG TPA: hypothetical protein [Bacteriophage sp.]
MIASLNDFCYNKRRSADALHYRKGVFVMRTIKKSISTTVADVFKIDLDTMAVEHVATREFVGGLGARLATSKCRREFGSDAIVKCHDVSNTYVMSGEDFIKYATIVDDDCDSDTVDVEE